MPQENPERIVYLLDADERRRLRVRIRLTRLLNWKAFRPAPIERLPELMQSSYKRYVRETDRRILARLMLHETQEGAEAAVDGADGWELLQAILETGRAFFAAGNRLRAAPGDSRRGVPEWTRDEQDRRQTAFRTAPGAALLLATRPPAYVDLASQPNRVGPVAAGPWPDALASDWLKAPPMDPEATATFCLRLLNRHPGHKVPVPDDLSAGDDSIERTRQAMRSIYRARPPGAPSE